MSAMSSSFTGIPWSFSKRPALLPTAKFHSAGVKRAAPRAVSGPRNVPSQAGRSSALSQRQAAAPALARKDFRWVLLAVVFDLSVYVCHAWRWNTLLAPVVRLRLWRTVQSVYIGLFANELLPLRTGEVIRCYLL